MLQYPSFELQFTNKSGNRQDGWFISDKMQTDYYAYIGVFSTTLDENSLTADNAISAVDMLWVKKSDVKDMVREQIDDESLQKDIAELQDDDCLDKLMGWNLGKVRKRYPHGKFWITYSANLKEKPVNLVTTRATLEKLPHSRHFVVTRERIKKL